MKQFFLVVAISLAALAATQASKGHKSSYPSQIGIDTKISSSTAGQALKLKPGVKVVPVSDLTLAAGGPTPSTINFGGVGIDFFSDGANASWVCNSNSEFDVTVSVPIGANYAVVTAGGWFSQGDVTAGIGNTDLESMFVIDAGRKWVYRPVKTDGVNFTVSSATKIGSEKVMNFAFGGCSRRTGHQTPEYPIYLHTIQVHFFKIVGGG